MPIVHCAEALKECSRHPQRSDGLGIAATELQQKGLVGAAPRGEQAWRCGEAFRQHGERHDDRHAEDRQPAEPGMQRETDNQEDRSERHVDECRRTKAAQKLLSDPRSLNGESASEGFTPCSGAESAALKVVGESAASMAHPIRPSIFCRI